MSPSRLVSLFICWGFRLTFSHQEDAAVACNIDYCRVDTFSAWSEYEYDHFEELQTLFLIAEDPFTNSHYYGNFCSIFYHQFHSCLRQLSCNWSHLANTTGDQWSLRAVARQHGYTFRFPPHGMLEHHIFRHDADIYIFPEFLNVICVTNWLPTMPMRIWCSGSDKLISAHGLIVEALIWRLMSVNQTKTCSVLYHSVNLLVNQVQTICPVKRAQKFFCRYYLAIFRLEFGYAFATCQEDICGMNKLKGLPPQVVNLDRIVNASSELNITFIDEDLTKLINPVDNCNALQISVLSLFLCVLLLCLW